MALSIFDQKDMPPTESDLANALKDSFQDWERIKSYVVQEYPTAKEKWNFAGAKWGWGYSLHDKKRAIVYLTPCDGCFIVGIVFGQKATDMAMQSTISESVKEEIMKAPVYGEGRGIRLDFNPDMLEDVCRMIDAKLKN